jgi:hypothetical protein
MSGNIKFGMNTPNVENEILFLNQELENILRG